MSAAQGGFQFAAINAADVQGFAIAVIVQLNVFSTHFETRMNEMMDPDISQDMGGQAQEIRASVEMQLSVALTEMNNRITRAEMRNEEIAAAGNRVVGDMGAWTTQTKAEIQQSRLELQQSRLELENVIQQAQVKFRDVEEGQQQLRSRDMEALKADFRSFVLQSEQVRSQDVTSVQTDFRSYTLQAEHHFQTLEARMDALALSAASAAQEDPWHRGGAGAAPRSPSEEGAAQIRASWCGRQSESVVHRQGTPASCS